MVDVNKLIQFAAGLMSEQEIIDFFQELINDGTVWRLQGSYGRTSQHLIDAGLCFTKERRLTATPVCGE